MGIFFSQSKYAQNLVKKFSVDKASHKRILTVTTKKVTKDNDVTHVEQTLYKSMIGSLLYLTVSCPDICHVVGLCAQFQANQK